MNSFAQQFSAQEDAFMGNAYFQTYNQAPINFPQGGYNSPVYSQQVIPSNGCYSPVFEANRIDASPSYVNHSTFGFSKMRSGSPVIKLVPCEQPCEENISADDNSVSPFKQPLLSKKLSLASKSYVARPLMKKNSSDRKESQDTKDQSDSDGNSTDHSDDDMIIPVFGVTKSANSRKQKMINRKSGEKVAHQSKFKTELCKNWQQGDCKFGTKCSFAHGVDELSERKNLPSNYKTKICKQFHDEGYCSYGTRCQFIHAETPNTLEDATLNDAICSLASIVPCKRVNKSRLSVFKSLTQEN